MSMEIRDFSFGRGKLKVRVCIAEESGFNVASVIVYGDTEAVVIDTQWTRPNALRVAAEVMDLRRDLKAIYVTHAHPDHYWGTAYIAEQFPGVTPKEVKAAAKAAYEAYAKWQADLKAEGARVLKWAEENHKRVAVLAGRPYHVDPEINHGIDRLLNSLGMAVITEDCVSDLVEPQKVDVLNQWTYHARLYNAAKYVTLHDNLELIQLVSFGCGIDAITTDEVRAILERGGKFYTQLKIDEINNLGAVKIRLRSLLGAIEEREAARAAKERS